MVKEHKDEREKLENDAWNEIDRIKEQNKEELTKITEAGLKSKADLQLISNRYKEAKNRKEDHIRDIQEKQQKLNAQIQMTNTMKQEIDG